MNNLELQSKLATHSPRLLSCKEAGMSEGPLLVDAQPMRNAVRTYKIFNLFSNPKPQELVCTCGSEANARFIAACNGERSVCELLWKVYGLLASLVGTLWAFTALKGWCNDLIGIQNEILLFLSAANRLGWVEKKEGE